MTYDSDPTRWTQAPDAAPDLLRDAFRAAHNEAPSDAQMRGLALKLAAVGSTGVAVGTGGASAHASAHGAATTAAGGIGATKITITLAVLAAIAGATTAYRSSAPQVRERADAPTVEVASHATEEQLPGPSQRIESGRTVVAAAPPSADVEQGRTPEAAPVARAVERAVERVIDPSVAPSAERVDAPAVDSTGGAERVEVRNEPKAVAAARARGEVVTSRAERRAPARAERRRERAAAASAREIATPASESARAPSESTTASTTTTRFVRSTAEAAKTPEIELLRRAREALDARPRETFRLTEVHRNEYPRGLFAQERDALAVEALLRSGENEKARERAAQFIDSYPSSPHAHRFRETLGLR